ncbi:cilium assembly protein DZIP1 isoform X2 [Dunckerocampus dactyliophorus]|uniref:cilium assembly protein DZIP1 isoform X2 n=1 Tax=Dunckerocampus dactyliophorus TaxID=161453 RepID=UPI0024071791|nr:cilium assembly protein DZIP1 isoform X2 [Dunckerocampus dactyliophorus]
MNGSSFLFPRQRGFGVCPGVYERAEPERNDGSSICDLRVGPHDSEMPFQDGVYYPYSSDTQGNHSSAGIPSLLNSPLSQYSARGQPAPGMAPSSATPTILPFRFRQRRESVDWRRIHAIDIDMVISQLDVDVLQEHISTVTFCSLDGERCQRCQSPVDRALIKILQLAQLTVEWLLHCQEFLTFNLQSAEERLASASMQQEQLLAQLKKQEESMKAMTTELKNRKKIIRNQQTLFAPQLMNSQKCAFCEKTFLNPSFLQSHMQRRHPDENDIQLQSNSEEKSQIQALKIEMNILKEQIVQQQQILEAKTSENQKLQRHIEENELQMREKENKSQIESLKQEIKNVKDIVQHHHIRQARTAEDEKQQSKDKDLLKELDHFKALEVVQMQAIQKLEQQQKQQDKKWESRLGKIKTLHESEKNELQTELDKLQFAMSEHQEHNLRQLQEMHRRLQEKEQIIQTQKEQIQNISSNPFTKVVKVPVLANTPAPEPKPKKVVLDLTSVPEKRPVEKKTQRVPEKKHMMSIKRNPNKKEIRRHLEQLLMTELESLGVKQDQRKLKTKDLKSILANRRMKQQILAKQMPDFWKHRDNICSSVDQKLGLQRKSRNPELQSPGRTRHSVQVLQSRPRSSSLPSRATQSVAEGVARQAKTPQPAPRVRTTTQPKTSTPSQKAALRDLTLKTPPFSSLENSEDEDRDMEDEDEPPQLQWGKMQARMNKGEAVQITAVKSNVIQAKSAPARHLPSNKHLVGGVTKTTVTKLEHDYDDDDEEEVSDVSELQEIDPRQLPTFKDQNGNVEKSNFAKDNKISDLAKKIERQVANTVSKKPAGGVRILPERKDEVQEFVSSDVEDSSEDADSFLEEKQGKFKASHNSGFAVRSLDSASTSVWDTSTGRDTSQGKDPRSGLTEGGTGSTLKSSLCYLSDICDSEDLNN